MKMVSKDEQLKEANKAIREKYKNAWEDYELPHDDEVKRVIVLNQIKQTELLQELIIAINGVQHEVGNQLRSFNREFEGKLRRSK